MREQAARQPSAYREMVEPSAVVKQVVEKYLAEAGYSSVGPSLVWEVGKIEENLASLSRSQLKYVLYSLLGTWPSKGVSRNDLTESILLLFLGDLDGTRWGNSHGLAVLMAIATATAVGGGASLSAHPKKTAIVGGSGVLGLAALVPSMLHYAESSARKRRASELLTQTAAAAAARHGLSVKGPAYQKLKARCMRAAYESGCSQSAGCYWYPHRQLCGPSPLNKFIQSNGSLS